MKMLHRDFDLAELAHLRILVLPSGIGEFQWVWTKMWNVQEKFAILAVDGAPRRLHQFASLHPQVEAFGYVGYDYSQIREFQKFHKLDTWSAIAEFPLGTPVMLACNPYLEAGKPLAGWLPDLHTTYSYPIEVTDAHRKEMVRVLHNAAPTDLLIGVSCASYRGAEAWHTWDHIAWTEFLMRIQRMLPNAKFVLLGGSWDDLTSNVYDPMGPLRFQLDSRGIPPVGTTSFGGAVSILQELDAYIGFSSGLGHVALHLCGTPTFMLWPEHEQALSTSWVDPALLASGSYVPSRWLKPAEVFNAAGPWLERIIAQKGVAV